MSLDIIELAMDIEEMFGVEVSRTDLDDLLARNNPPDIRAGDLYDLIEAKHPTKRICQACRYDLRGHVSPGCCPECGKRFDDWDRFRPLVAMHCNTAPESLTRDSLLVRDFDKHW